MAAASRIWRRVSTMVGASSAGARPVDPAWADPGAPVAVPPSPGLPGPALPGPPLADPAVPGPAPPEVGLEPTTIGIAPVSTACQRACSLRRARIHRRTPSAIPSARRTAPTATPGTSHGVVTVCGHESTTTGAFAPSPPPATSSVHRPACGVHVSSAERAPTAWVTQRSEPSGSGAAAAAGSAGAAASAGASLGTGVGSAVGSASAASIRNVLRSLRPAMTACGSVPTQPATSASRPIASTTLVPPFARAVTVTGAPPSSRTPGAVTSSVPAPVGMAEAVATRVSCARHAVAEATPSAMEARPSTLRTMAIRRCSTHEPFRQMSFQNRRDAVGDRPDPRSGAASSTGGGHRPPSHDGYPG